MKLPPGDQSDEPTLILDRQGLLFFHKPAGYASHPGGLHKEPDMVTWIREHHPSGEEASPINRLDLETSGIFVAAGEKEARGLAGSWFSDGLVQKTYLALVRGRTRKKGVIQRPLRSHSGKNMEEARTAYRLLGWIGPYSLLQVEPATGRKHQIRRHLTGLGHPIIGDKRYGNGKKERNPILAPRCWLHAWKLQLPDGTVVEDPLPPDLVASLTFLLEKYSGGSEPEDTPTDSPIIV